jgi:pseudouridine kinase
LENKNVTNESILFRPITRNAADSSISHVSVVGAVNVDISGTPAAPLVERDSNPGRITLSFGGVGRNIADNMARLGMMVELITVLGDDAQGEGIRKDCRAQGIGLDHALLATGRSTSGYLCINDEKGDMQVAINDMSIYDCLTPEVLQSRLPLINRGGLLVIDANLPAAAIGYLASHATVPLLAEPVSSLKAGRLLPILDKIRLLKPNRLEAEILSGVAISDDESLEKAADALLAKGVKQVCISLGSEGVYCAEKRYREKIANFPARVVNTTGCGDAFMAACAWGTSQGLDLPSVARLGLAAAAICIESTGAVSSDMTLDNVLRKSGLTNKA